MSESTARTADRKAPRISLDTWAVLVALLAAVLIRTGVITRVPW